MKNSIISLICFLTAGFAVFLLFVGLFTAKKDYIIEHLFDSLYVIGLGTLIPVLFIVGTIYLIKSIQKREVLFFLPLIVCILIFIFCVVYYLPTLSFIIELYQIK